MIFNHNETIEKACSLIAVNDFSGASRVVAKEYPFSPPQKSGRHYTPTDMTRIFRRDGFIDRYKGTRLIFPPVLHLLSHYLPTEFPYQTNWKMAECHMAYWQLMPTIDHKMPVARGGADAEENWVCCSMLTNSIKSNWTLEELQWALYPPGDPAAWDGMMGWFLQQVTNDPSTLDIPYISHWHGAAVETMHHDKRDAFAIMIDKTAG